ncbi:MAG: TOBE domain-containing protein, partial [Pseudomonadota bacterium]
LAFRPEQMRAAVAGEASSAEGSVIATRVLSRSYIGGRWQVALDLGGGPIRLETEVPPPGEELPLFLPREGAILFPGVSHVAA